MLLVPQSVAKALRRYCKGTLMPIKESTRRGKWYVQGTLLNAVTGTVSGSWERIDGVFPFTITVEGSFTGTVKIYASNADTAPSDADGNHGILQTFTGPGVYTLNAPFEFIKAATTGVTGTVSVIAEGSRA